MDEDRRDPWTCASCGAVNPWMNERCRSCGSSRSAAIVREESEPSTRGGSSESRPSDGDGSTAKPSFNIRAALAGAVVFLLAILVGQFLIMRFIVFEDPELRRVADEVAERTKGGGEIDEVQTEELRAAFFANSAAVVSLSLLLLLTPLLSGLLIGYMAGRLLEGAVTCGVAMALMLLLEGAGVAALAIGPVYAGLGALGALAGVRIRSVLR